jgi:hypothetical protein
MMRLACFFGLVALVALFPLIVRLDGATATVFSFLGMPSLAIALAIYVVARWRAGDFGESSRH